MSPSRRHPIASHRFTSTDVKVPGFDAELRGMYAIALYDPASDRLVLSRDPFGIKPLYYAEGSQGFAFASEAQALVAAGLVEARINPQARDELLQLQFTTGADTIFSGIKRVLPGETIVVSAGRIIDRHRRDALPASETAIEDERDVMSRLDAALNDSVTIHQRSDVPFGMFLSGGVDSSTLLALMARLNDHPVLAFTVGFPGSGAHDERAHARMLAEHVGAEHVDVPIREADFGICCPRSPRRWTIRGRLRRAAHLRPGTSRGTARQSRADRRGRGRTVCGLWTLSKRTPSLVVWRTGDASAWHLR